MKPATTLGSAILALTLAACKASDTVTPTPPVQGVRVVNAFTAPVDVLIDGSLAASAVAPAALDTMTALPGAHVVQLRRSGDTGTVTLPVATTSGGIVTVAAVLFNGGLAASALDDTNAVVPDSATKVRVIHLAPNAGEIQVFSTPPGASTPYEWQFPFLYDSVVTTMSNPYVQGTVGTWDIRAWRKPSEVALGWDGTSARVTLNLASGEKRTVLVLDKPGGGIQLSVIK